MKETQAALQMIMNSPGKMSVIYTKRRDIIEATSHAKVNSQKKSEKYGASKRKKGKALVGAHTEILPKIGHQAMMLMPQATLGT